MENPRGMKKGMRGARCALKWGIAWVVPLLLGACAGLPRDASLPVNDPNEDMNRHVMEVNQVILRPASEFVKAAIPGPVHDRVHDLNSNLKEPRILVNNVLQGRFEADAQTSARFVMNSVFGIGGPVYLASPEGPPPQHRGFRHAPFFLGVPPRP